MRVAVVVDNEAKNARFRAEYGLSFYINKGRSHILFDTGQGRAFRENLNLLKIDSEQIDTLVFSHGHYDHAGGVSRIFRGNSRLKIYAHPGILAKKYSCHRKGNGKFSGVRPLDVKWINSHKKDITWTSKPTRISAGIYATGEIPRLTDFEDTGGAFYLNKRCTIPDMMADDQAVFVKTKKGIVIFLGCAHSGIVNTMNYVAKLARVKKIYAVLGGAHLLKASRTRIDRTIEALARYKVQKIILGHCTGGSATKLIKKAFPKEFFQMKAGMKFFIE